MTDKELLREMQEAGITREDLEEFSELLAFAMTLAGGYEASARVSFERDDWSPEKREAWAKFLDFAVKSAKSKHPDPE